MVLFPSIMYFIHFRKAMLDIAIPQDTGYPVNGTGTAIEMCRDCPKGYEGYSCEECSQVMHFTSYLQICYEYKNNYELQRVYNPNNEKFLL